MSIRSQMAKGAAWMVGLRMVDRGIGLISTIILARLLAPEDFGLVAMAMAVYGLLELLGAFGIDVVLIQHQNPQRKHYDTAWTLSVIVLGAQAGLLYLLAQPASAFFDDPRVGPAMQWLALGFVLDGIHNVGVVNFRRNLQFNKEFIYLFTRRIIGFLVTVVMAYQLHSYWALIIGMLCNRGVGLILSYSMEPYRPRFSLAAFIEIYNFSKHLLLNNMLQFCTNRAPDFILGHLVGANDVGLFRVSYDIAAMPISEIAAPINRAALPGYSRVAEDRTLLAETFLSVFSLVAAVILPLGIGIASVADILVPLALGPKWTAAIPAVQLLGVWSALAGLVGGFGAVYLALGRPQIVSRLTAVRLMLTLPLVWYFSGKWGVVGATAAITLGTALMVPLYISVASRILPVRLNTLLHSIFRPFIAVTAMFFAVSFVMNYTSKPPTGMEQILDLTAAVSLGATVYIVICLSLWQLCGRPKGSETTLIDILSRILQRIHRLMLTGMKHLERIV